LTSALALLNLVLSSTSIIVSFSLVVYFLTHNIRSNAAKAFCALISFVMFVYIGDVMLAAVNSAEGALPWLRFQWLGIAFVPAAYLHFSASLLRSTNDLSPFRRLAVVGSYILSLMFFLLAMLTDTVVADVIYMPWTSHFSPGPLFWVFTFYFLAASAGGLLSTLQARSRCLTSTARRRMTYLSVAFLAPGLGAFPYLLLASMPDVLTPNRVLLLNSLGNAAVALMTVLMAYAVAYQGVFLPDRVVKRNLIHYLLRGPVVGACVIFLMLVIPRVERILGVSRDTFLILTVVAGIVLLQLIINAMKPYIDRVIYRRDREEITWIQQLDTRLLTTTDLEQILENTLTAICEGLRLHSGFIVILHGESPRLQTFCGPEGEARTFLGKFDTTSLANLNPSDQVDRVVSNDSYILQNGFWLLPLLNKIGDSVLGALGIEARGEAPDFSAEELKWVTGLVAQVELALEDVQLQREVFTALQRIIPDIERMQRWKEAAQYGTPIQDPNNMVDQPDFVKWVKDALSHYWGGPKLSQSPLVELQVVEEALPQNSYAPTRALQAVLLEAIENLRPNGTRAWTTQEWMLYNILDLKFIQGRRIREIAHRMAMSESDFYRKQRVAVEAVATTLADMERRTRKKAPSLELGTRASS
jgi:hypothetical protein